MKIYYYSCSWQDCALSMRTVSLHSKNIAFANKSAPLVSYISKKGYDLQAGSGPHRSLRAGGSHLTQSHQKSVALGTCHSLGTGWELVTWSQKWEHFRGREETLFIQKWDSLMYKELFPTSRRPQHHLQAKPTGLLKDLCFVSFFLNTSKERFASRVTWDNLCVSVCFSS